MTVSYTCCYCDPPVLCAGKRGYNTHVGRVHKDVKVDRYKVRYEKRPCHFCNMHGDSEKRWTTSSYTDAAENGSVKPCCMQCKRRLRQERKEEA